MLWRARAIWPMLATATIGVLPIVVLGWALWQSGDYTAPRLSWRSGPGGVDLATFALGNPWHPISGGWTRDIYGRLGINPIESLGWLGVAPLGLVVYGIMTQLHEKEVRRWLPAPFPMTAVTVPGLYRELPDSRDGAVCELPIGLRDGFGMAGLFDDRTLSYQMVHGHPIVGGFSARIPASIKQGYEELPVVRSLFRLSAGGAADPRDMALTRETAGAALQQATIEFIVLNRSTAPAALVTYVDTALPLELVAHEGQRDLYVVYTPRRNALMNGSATFGIGTDSPSSTSRDVTRTP